MTEFQKKKLIDLSLIIVSIILVGLFLKTQLSNPIILNIDETTESEINKTYLVGSHHEDVENLDSIGVADLTSISVVMDSAYIDVVVALRELPVRLPTENNKYNWTIYFDVDGDNTEQGDILIEHKNDLSSFQNTLFTTTIMRINAKETELLGLGESEVDGNLLLIRIPNSKMLEINENTPYKVIVSHQIDDVLQQDEMPKGK